MLHIGSNYTTSKEWYIKFTQSIIEHQSRMGITFRTVHQRVFTIEYCEEIYRGEKHVTN